MPADSLNQVVTADAPPETESFPEEQAAAARHEIDAISIVNEMQSASSASARRVTGLGLECGVGWVPQKERVPTRVSPCPVCRGREAIPTYAIENLDFRLVTCTVCGLGRLNPLPDAETIRNFYPPEYYGVTGAKFVPMVEKLIRVVGARQARAITHGLVPGSRVLDVGCGRGVLLSTLADRGFEAHGFEISETAATGADPRANIRVRASLQEVAYRSRFFDAVVLWHVLEHLPDPREALTEIRRIMRRGGRLAVAVPNFSSIQARWSGPAWFHLDLPRHLYHFPKDALCRLLSECGFECVSEHHFSLRQNPFGWVQSALNRSPNLPRNGLYTLLKQRGSENGPPFDAATRSRFWLAYTLGMPVAIAASVVEAMFRSGASVSVMAVAR